MNLLLAPWLGPEASPDFKAFKTEDFLPAFHVAIEESRRGTTRLRQHDPGLGAIGRNARPRKADLLDAVFGAV
jgi:Zn-dependent oligopeptidase